MRAAIDPALYDAVLFDLDGVVTDTASVHFQAWVEMFDDYLRERAARLGGDAEEAAASFTAQDYRRHVDGKLRQDGVADFLASRGITLPWGEPTDGPEVETVHGLGNRKDRRYLSRIAAGDVVVFDSTVDLIRSLQAAGLGTAVFSASRNCRQVLESAGLGKLFAVRVDGVVAEELGLPGKPDPATLLEAAHRLGVPPPRTVVVEDALSGVEAGRRGGFGFVIGVDRAGHGEEMRRRGADVVVDDLAAVEVGPRDSRPLSEVPAALTAFDEVRDRVSVRGVAVFLDFDGALSPIVDQPEAARPADGAPEVLQRLAASCPVAIISGRDLPDVRRRVGVEDIWYAGSHGYELAGPGGRRHEYEEAHGALASLDEAEATLRDRLASVPGAVVERKKYSVTAHYRTVAPGQADAVVRAVDDVAAALPDLRATRARKAAELVPDLKWNKGYAVRWLLGQLSPAEGRLTPVYAGDDLTDEDALRVVGDVGLGIVVRSDEHGDRPTAAHVAVDSPEELVALLGRLAETLAAAPQEG